MAYDLHLHIESGSPEGAAVEMVANEEHISLEEAARTILRRAGEDNMKSAGQVQTTEDKPGAKLIGLMASPEDAALMDEVVDMAMAARRKRWERVLGA